MKATLLSTLPCLVVGARAANHHGRGDAGVDTPWEIWAAAATLPSRLQLAADGAEADYDMVDGHALFHFNGGVAPVMVRVMLTGTPGAMFIAANADADIVITPAGAIPGARLASLLLIHRALLFDTQGWWIRMQAFQQLRPVVAENSISPAELAAFVALRREIEARKPPVHRASMRASNESFFGEFKHDDIRVYEHDDLHRFTCYYEQPLYLTAKDDRSQAIIPRRNFERMSHLDRGRLVREECHAIALERVVVPAQALGRPCNPADAYLYALHRICTDLSTGWFRDFAIECFDELAHADTDYAGRFANAVDAGLVRPRRNGDMSPGQRRAMEQSLARVAERQRIAGLPVIR
ncbi:MAG: hypothetical protein ABI777_06065 [Betaproteobacteria bacterium]